MSFDQAIETGKERRRPYRGAKAVDATCRNHGTCPTCRRLRQYRNNMAEADAVEQMKEPYDPYNDDGNGTY